MVEVCFLNPPVRSVPRENPKKQTNITVKIWWLDETDYTHKVRAHLPLEYEIEPVSNNSHPYHLGAHVVTEVEPDGEVKWENITWVSNGGHEVEEVMVFPVVALHVLYYQHPAAVDQIHQELEVCVCSVLVDAPSAPVKAPQTPPTPTTPLYLSLVS